MIHMRKSAKSAGAIFILGELFFIRVSVVKQAKSSKLKIVIFRT
jgi:hypothetical protein